MHRPILSNPTKTGMRLAAGLVLGLLVAWAFVPVLAYDFVLWDDNVNVTGNAMLTKPWSWDLVMEMLDPQAALRFKPLHWLAMRVIADTTGMQPAVWHTFGWGVHACAAVAVFWVLRLMMERAFHEPQGWWTDALAWLGAALWALHPLRVEPVAWVTGSTYPMVGLLMAVSFGSYLKAHGAIVDKKWLWFSRGLAVAAYATYPVSVTYAGWLVVADVFWLRTSPEKPWNWRDRETRRWWGKHAWFVVPAVFAVGATLWTRYADSGRWVGAPSLGVLGWDERLLAAWASLTALPAKVLWPVNLTPNVQSLQQTVWQTGWVLGFAALSCAVAAALWALSRRRPAWMGTGLGFALLALPCLGLTERPIWPVDRYGYLLDMVVIGVAVMTFAVLSQRRVLRLPVLALLVALTAGATVATRNLLPIWRNSTALFASMESMPDFANNPTQQAHIYTLWYAALARKGLHEEASEKLERANGVYLSAMRGAVALGDYKRAVGLADCMEANLGLSTPIRRERGGWLLRLGRKAEATEDLRRVLRDVPDDARAAGFLAEATGGGTGGK